MDSVFMQGETPTFLARILNVELVSDEELVEYNGLLLQSELTDEEQERLAELESIVDNAILLPQDVKSMTYTVTRTMVYGSYGGGTDSSYVDIPIELGTATEAGPFQEKLIQDDHLWTNDKIGYNFKWTPKVVGSSLPFPDKGYYNITFTINVNENLGNPIRWSRVIIIS